MTERVHKRAYPHAGEPNDATSVQRLPRTVSVRLDHGVAHFVAEVGRVEPQQNPEPALRHMHQTIAPHVAVVPSRPPIRAARVSASIRRASAFAARRPTSVMR